MALSLPIIVLIGGALRTWLFRSRSLAQWLSERPELVTPLTSWKRVTEGLALKRAGVAPYDGDVYHETPLMLRVVDLADAMLGGDNMWLLILAVDLSTAVVLSRVAVEIRKYLLQQQASEEKMYCLFICLIFNVVYRAPAYDPGGLCTGSHYNWLGWHCSGL